MIGLFGILMAIEIATTEPAFELPKNETCATIFAVESYEADKRYLTPTEKCQIDRWQAGQEHGVRNNKIWVRIEGELFSLHRDVLKNLREDQAEMVFKREIKKQYKIWKSKQTKEN